MIPEIISTAKACNDITKGNQISFFNWIMVNFFGKHYLKYLVKNLVLEWTAKVEAEKQIATFAQDPHPMMALIRAEGELEYKNMFGVLQKALPKITNSAPSDTPIILDKMKRLKDLSKEFSSEDMQELIAAILAWEYNQPWSFSLKTLEIVRNLGKDDIEIFRKFWWIIFDGKDFFSHFYNWGTEWNRIMYQEWIWYDSYLRLIELGLVLKINSMQSIWIDESDLPSDISANLPPSVLLALQQNPEISYLYRIQGQELSLRKTTTPIWFSGSCSGEILLIFAVKRSV